MDVTQFVRIAIPLVAAIGKSTGMASSTDIKPANGALIDAAGNVPPHRLRHCVRSPRERQARAARNIAGTLAYMAPEQTGRMNRSIDAAAILIARRHVLRDAHRGASVTATDPMGWIHCHIARRPTPPSERVSGIPGPGSRPLS